MEFDGIVRDAVLCQRAENPQFSLMIFMSLTARICLGRTLLLRLHFRVLPHSNE